jgi:hypothetical protein
MGNNEDAMAHLAPGQGSFGSAGASRSLRKTATAAGSGHTATVMALKPNTLPVQMDEPSVEDMWRSIKLMQCCWCNDTRTFQSLSMHWTRSHGMDLQSIRDRLQVPKNYSFISDALKSVFTTRGKNFYNPDKLKCIGGSKVMSEYGKATNLAKLAAIPSDQREEARLRGVQIAVKNREAITRQYELDHPCIICGVIFTRITYHATTCSKTCNEVRRLAKADRSPHPERRGKRNGPR